MKLDSEVKQEMRSWVREYINELCIVRSKLPEEKYKLKAKSGGYYIWQFYLRRGLFNSKFLNCIGCLFWDIYSDQYSNKPFQIAGLETGSTPLIVGLSMTAPLFNINLNAFSIRQNRKTYGLLNRMEGLPDPNLPVLLVDDLCNSKDTLYEAKKHIEWEKLNLYDSAFTIINKNINVTDSDKYDKYIGKDLPVVSLFYTKDFDLSYEDYKKAIQER